MKAAVFVILAAILACGGGYYVYKSNAKPDMISQFNVTNERVAKDLEGRTASLPYGQVWPFEPPQGITAVIISKKQVEDFVIIVVEVKATADVAPPKTEKDAKPPPLGIKSVKVGLSGLVKLTYEKISSEWYLVGIETVSLRAFPLVEGKDGH